MPGPEDRVGGVLEPAESGRVVLGRPRVVGASSADRIVADNAARAPPRVGIRTSFSEPTGLR
jgi:hypothetical protein